MDKVLLLYLVTRVLNDTGRFREHDFMSTEQIESLQDMSQDLCLSLKPHCIKLSDAFGSKEKLL